MTSVLKKYNESKTTLLDRISPYTILVFLYMFSISFDFRRTEADSGILVILLSIINIILGLTLLLSNSKLNKSTIYFVSPFILFIASASIASILRGQDLYSIASHALPVAIFVLAVVNISNTKTENFNGVLTNIIIATSLFALLWKLYFGFLYYSLDSETVRYQIISGSVPLVFSYGIASLLIQKRRLRIFSIAASALVVLLSVTRTYLLVFFISFAYLWFSLPRRGLSKRIREFRRILIYAAVTISSLVALQPGFASRWLIRLATPEETGVDLTALTRFAEMNFQVQELSNDTLGMLFGFGHAAKTKFSGPDALLVAKIIGNKGLEYTGTGYGHNFYVGLIYVGGILFGGLIIYKFFSLLLKSRTILRLNASNLKIQNKFLLAWGISSYAGYLTYGMLGGTFGDRSASFYFGISAGLIIRQLSKMQRDTQKINHTQQL